MATYRRKHNPVVNWLALGERSVAPSERPFLLPDEANLGFAPTRDPATGKRYRGFDRDAEGAPLPYESLPTVSLVVPDQAHDAHDGSLHEADEWMREHIGPYLAWARTHGALLVVTLDEDGSTDRHGGDPYRFGRDRIATLFVGPMVRPGRYEEPVDHLNVLATLLLMHGDLARFRREFAAAHPGEEGARELANLRPILDVFGAGAPLEALPVAR